MCQHGYTRPVLAGSTRKKTSEQQVLFFHLLLCSAKRHDVLFILHCYPVQIWVFDSESAHKKSELYGRSLGARADLDRASGLSDWLWNKKAGASGGGRFGEPVSCGRYYGILLLLLLPRMISRLRPRGETTFRYSESEISCEVLELLA